MQYGYFAGQEYVITDPRTPVKWINYIGTLAFGGYVDATGGALICKGDPALNRITRYMTSQPDSDFKGETLYVRARTAAEGVKIWSPFFVPTLDEFDRYECRVGLGYTRIVSEFYGIRTEATIFVPPGQAVEIRDYVLTNLSSQPVELDAIPVVDYTHPDALKQLTNADWVPQTMQSRAAPEPDGQLVLIQYPFMLRDSRINLFTSNLPVSSFETDRRAFLGDNGYGTWASPLGLHADELGCGQANRGDNMAALLHHLGALQPGESRRMITLLTQAESLAAARPLVERFRQPQAVEEAFEELGRYWASYLSRFQAHTPDENLNAMVNVHNPRQCQTTLNWSRYLSLYQLGYGARGIGFRDSSQDVMGVLASLPEQGLALIRQLLSVQKRDGSAMHQFNPLTMEGSVGDSAERDDRPKYYSDDHLWIVPAVCAYLKETGNLAFLDETIPFYEKERDGRPLESASVLDHLRRALAFTRGDRGVHGLPRLGFADWNDTVNLPAGAESLFSANLYAWALRSMIELARVRGDEAEAARCEADYEAMRQAVEDCAWDGEWYVSYFDADGTPMGSRANSHGQIYVTGQPWPVLSGLASPERARQALESVARLLATRHGIKLSTPAFNGFDPARGGITTYPPGAKENGGIFLHTNPWVIIAETLVGNGDRALDYYNRINPAARNGRIEEYECEPYVYPQNILGDEHPQFGLARNSWLSGTASWMYQAATQYILGIRPAYQGLQIDPCIPRGWAGFRVRRHFRGAWYSIEVRNPEGVCQGVQSITLDGHALAGDTIPAAGDGQEHQVAVTLGR